MDILIDAERLRNPHSGLGQFCRWLGHELIRSRPADARMTFLVPAGQRGVFGTEVAYSAATWWRRVWRDDAFDVWHMTHQDSAFRPAPKARLVLTIQDLNFLERPDYSAAKQARRLASLQRTVNRASTVVTLSHYTAMVVRRHLRAPGVPVRVIYPGNPLAASDAEETPTGAPPAIRALAPP